MSMWPSAKPRVIVTAWTSGKKASDKYCIDTGKIENGKKVPLKRNIGVMKRYTG